MATIARVFQAQDLLPIELHEATWGGRRLEFNQPLVLFPTLSETGQILLVENATWNLHAAEESREALIAEIEEQLVVNWVEYALEGDTGLTTSARGLKARMLERLREV